MSQPTFEAWLNRKAKGPAPKRRIPRITKKRAKQVRQYNAEIKAFLEANPVCGVWLKENGYSTFKPGLYCRYLPDGTVDTESLVTAQHLLREGNACRATQVHHTNKRRGEMLNDQRYWLPVSAEGHGLIEDNKNWARSRGYLLNF